MTIGVYDNCYTCWNGYPTNPGDVGVGLRRSNANRVALVPNTRVPDSYIVITANIEARFKT